MGFSPSTLTCQLVMMLSTSESCLDMHTGETVYVQIMKMIGNTLIAH